MTAIRVRAKRMIAVLTGLASAGTLGAVTYTTYPLRFTRPLFVKATTVAASRISRFFTHQNPLCSSA